MMWLPDGEKISKIPLFVLTECTNVTDTRTDGQAPHDGIGRAWIASRGKIGYRYNFLSCRAFTYLILL